MNFVLLLFDLYSLFLLLDVCFLQCTSILLEFAAKTSNSLEVNDLKKVNSTSVDITFVSRAT